jgi:radical SAM superfamily enzyme YgiQ (UPF0313 family)
MAKIGKLYFGSDTFQYGLELCLSRAGRTALLVDEKTAGSVDILLVSMFWFKDIYILEQFLRKSNLKNATKRPIIIAGGMQCTMTPEIISMMVDYVFIGDGDDYLGKILEEIEDGKTPSCKYIYTKDMKQIPLPAVCEPSGFMIRKGSGMNTSRIEIARGCKFKCSFCCLSNLKPYKEVPFSEIKKQIDLVQGKTCSCFAPERAIHSDWAKIEKYVEQKGLKDFGQDARLENIEKINKNTVTFGLEGISLKLRKLIKKPFTDEYILEKMGGFVNKQNRISMISAYFIADLPTENEDDWEEIWSLFEKIEKENWSRFLTFKPILNPFSPKKFTPLVDSVIHPMRDYGEKWNNLLRKNGGKWGFRIGECMVWSPWLRTVDVIVQRGGSKAYEIVSKFPSKYLDKTPNKLEHKALCKILFDECKKIGIYDQLLVEI